MQMGMRQAVRRGCLGLAGLSGVVAFQHVVCPGALSHTHCRSAPRALGAIGGEGVALASSVKTPRYPTTVLVHGLDSSKETWSGVLSDLSRAGFPAIALDLRGHGESPMGHPKDFGPEALARDVIRAIETQGLAPVVLVGHSMGGRVAMHVADLVNSAEAVEGAELLAALVIEDMDVAPRPGPAPADSDLSADMRQQLRGFETEQGRLFNSWDACRKALLQWYEDEARVDSWFKTRVRPVPGGFWSDINPAAHRLARTTILSSPASSRAWDRLATAPFPIHLWVAGAAGTVCAWEGDGGIHDMTRRVPGARTHEFKDAAHSIHNSAREEFMGKLESVIRASVNPAGR